jgi:hypothetical protein
VLSDLEGKRNATVGVTVHEVIRWGTIDSILGNVKQDDSNYEVQQ